MRHLIKSKSSQLILPMNRGMMGGAAQTPVDKKYQQALKQWETKDRTSLQFTLSETPGALNKAISIFTSNKINMTRIVSKPTKFVENNWREVDFFIDLEGEINSKPIQKAI